MDISQKLSSYDFDLPKELIAQVPADKRDMARLLVLDKKTGKIEHRQFKDIIEYLQPGDCLVLNKTKVFPARLFGKKETGGKVETLFLKQVSDTRWLVLLKPFIEAGKTIILPDGLFAKVIEKTPLGETLIEIPVGTDMKKVLEKFGKMPLPPYIKRELGSTEKDRLDRERYQTVFAEIEGSIAAPTASLHFTPELINEIKKKVDIAEIVLHVGWGTFRPIIADDVTQHKMLPESFEISKEAIEKIRTAKAGNGRVVVVGTTASRALEACADKILGDGLEDLTGATDIFICPGHKFYVPDVFVTNFHLPGSTPLMMACAFAGKDNIFNAYREAINLKYRFFSYGDSMLII